MYSVTVILPVHNAAKHLEHAVSAIMRYLPQARILIAEDGSTDSTVEIASLLCTLHSSIFLLSYPVRLGKGLAIKQAIRQVALSSHSILVMDVDLATDLNCLPQASWTLKAKGGLVVGSRHLKASKCKRGWKRTLTSWAFNSLVRLLFRDGIRDHQCGFKLLSPQVYEVASECVGSNGFFYDTELILQVKRFGFNVSEIPVAWQECRGESTVKVWRDSAKMLRELAKLRLHK